MRAHILLPQATTDSEYIHDLGGSELNPQGAADLRMFPGGVEDPYRSWREAESAYIVRGGAPVPVWKRWQEERSPSHLYNFGFHDMESLGAVYRCDARPPATSRTQNPLTDFCLRAVHAVAVDKLVGSLRPYLVTGMLAGRSWASHPGPGIGI